MSRRFIGSAYNNKGQKGGDMRLHAFFAALAVACLPGCAIFEGEPDPTVLDTDMKGVKVIAYPERYRAAYVVQAPGEAGQARISLCAEPPPDVAFNRSVSNDLDVDAEQPAGPEVSAGASGTSDQRATELSGRSELILLVRELLFRTCEMTINSPEGIDDGTASHYAAILDLIKTLGKAELEDAEARRMEAQTELAKTVGTRLTLARSLAEHFVVNGKFDTSRWKTFIGGVDDARVNSWKGALSGIDNRRDLADDLARLLNRDALEYLLEKALEAQ